MSSIVKHVVATVLVLTIGAAAAGAAFVWSGAYDIGADGHHADDAKKPAGAPLKPASLEQFHSDLCQLGSVWRRWQDDCFASWMA